LREGDEFRPFAVFLTCLIRRIAMNGLYAFCLTGETINGYLCPLFLSPYMERDQTLPAQTPTHELSPPHSATERLNQRHLPSTLSRLARSTRGRLGAVMLAVAGTGVAAKESDAATIMMQGEIIPRSEETEQPEYALALTNDEFLYSIGHADGTADATMTWFGVRSPDLVVERYVEMGSDVPNAVVAPDQFNDGIRSEFFLTKADLPELASLRYAIDSRYPDGSGANLHRFLENGEVLAGFGPVVGNPTTLDEAIEMTDGPVMRAFYSGNVELDDAWIFRSVHQQANTPEPATLGLAGAALAAGLASRRRLKGALQEQN
jgi:hypothetical protein